MKVVGFMTVLWLMEVACVAVSANVVTISMLALVSFLWWACWEMA